MKPFCRGACVGRVVSMAGAVCLLMGVAAHAAQLTPVHRYDFEQDDASDSVGALDGAVEGNPAFSDDAMSGNRSMFFNGDDTWIQFPQTDFTENFSVAAWVWPDSAATWPDYNLMTIVGSKGGWPADGFKLYMNQWMPDEALGPNDHLIVVESGAGVSDSGREVNSGDAVLEMEQWSHVAMSVDVNGTEVGIVNVYINGEKVIDSGEIQAAMDVNQDWTIGAMDPWWGLWMGMLDDVQLYTGILSDAQAQWLYDNPGEAIGVVPPDHPLGDVNLDGDVNGLDVDPFVGLVTSGGFQDEADMNGDGAVNGLDVDPFVAAVVGAGAAAVPEPSTCVLALLGVALALGLRLPK